MSEGVCVSEGRGCDGEGGIFKVKAGTERRGE